MTREINVEEAASWTKEELRDNVQYLQTRERHQDVDRIREILQDAKAAKTSKKGDKE